MSEDRNGRGEVLGAQTPFQCQQDLLRRAVMTARIRFNAARRLEAHNRLGRWTLALASVGITVIPLMQVFSVRSTYSPQLLNIVQILLALVLLVFSLLTTQEGFALRADRQHRSAIEINALAAEMRTALTDDLTSEAHLAFARRYHDLLLGYENHSPVDNIRYDAQYGGSRVAGTAYWMFRLAFEFGHYLAAILLVLSIGILVIMAAEIR